MQLHPRTYQNAGSDHLSSQGAENHGVMPLLYLGGNVDYLTDFSETHNIEKKNLSDIKVAVECIGEAHKIAWNFIAYVDNHTEKDELIVHTHLNLIERIHEQAKGMLACIATKFPTSAEALARIVTEGSINLIYISRFGDEKTIAAFFNSWILEHKRKLVDWKANIVCKPHENVVGYMIDQRLSTISKLESYVDIIASNLSIKREDILNHWPKSLYKRFKALGLEDSYYSIYHRLSGSSHITAEDTILWLMFLQQSNEHKISLAKEAWAYSIMMTRIVCTYFIDALAACCIAHGLKDEEVISRLAILRNNLNEAAAELAELAGVPKKITSHLTAM